MTPSSWPASAIVCWSCPVARSSRRSRATNSPRSASSRQWCGGRGCHVRVDRRWGWRCPRRPRRQRHDHTQRRRQTGGSQYPPQRPRPKRVAEDRPFPVVDAGGAPDPSRVRATCIRGIPLPRVHQLDQPVSDPDPGSPPDRCDHGSDPGASRRLPGHLRRGDDRAWVSSSPPSGSAPMRRQPTSSLGWR